MSKKGVEYNFTLASGNTNMDDLLETSDTVEPKCD